MNKPILLIIFVILLTILYSCSNEDTDIGDSKRISSIDDMISIAMDEYPSTYKDITNYAKRYSNPQWDMTE